MRRGLSKIPLLSPLWHPNSHQKRLFHLSAPRSSTITLPQQDVVSISSPTTHNNAHELLRAQKLANLEGCFIRRDTNPSRVWAHYVDVLNYIHSRELSLEIHQQVLRGCTPSSAELRVANARRLIAGNRPPMPHIHEGRFQRVIRNIRNAGWNPTLEDYHFVLEQFAAVGHHNGSVRVYNELISAGLRPRTKTFGLCLQAIAHRLSLPCTKIERPRLLQDSRRISSELMSDMSKYDIPFTSVNLDLTIRVLKEALDTETFELLLKLAYGIDLAYPDRAPLFLGEESKIKLGGALLRGLPAPRRFTTSSLNTTIDMLGRFGNISKLVQSFEVLTQPLPSQASQHLSSSFEDDEDDDAINPPSTQTLVLPHATPNTTTYNLLLKYVSRAGHAAFARHYMLEVMQLDHATDRRLRGDLRRLPMDQVLSPHFAINRGTVLSVFGEANRDKNLQLMRWLSSKMPKIIRRKRGDLAHYTQLRNQLRETQKSDIISDANQHLSTETPPIDHSSTTSQSSSDSLDTPSTATAFRRRVPKPVPSSPAFEVDLDDPSVPQPPPVKYFNLDLHLRILQRDLEQLEGFSLHIQDVLGRTSQRVKERLGRRVWNGKDVYLRHMQGRVTLSREAWQRVVEFKPRWRSVRKPSRNHHIP